jgi:predicted DNA binding protein
MCVLVEGTVSAEEFVLADALGAVPAARVELERAVEHSRKLPPCPYAWVRGDDGDDFEAALESDRTVERAARLDAHDRATLYEIAWRPSVERRLSTVLSADATVLGATGQLRRWRFSVRFPSREAASTAYRDWRSAGLDFEPLRIARTADSGGEHYGLTEAQEEALLCAVDAGYFDVPRGITTSELADRLGISTNAVSQRLHRGCANLVHNTLRSSK